MQKNNRIAGVDLGTTYSCIACMDDMGRPEVIWNREGTLTTPSVVRLKPGEAPVVGATAKETSFIYPEYTIEFVKSRIGKEKSFEYGPEDNRLTTTPADVSAEILKKVVRDAEELSDSEIKDVVITVPAYFGIREKEETKRAGEKAGLNVIDIVEEPTAAAFYYGIQKSSDNETVCIFDLGGGTFDVTAMKIGNSGEEKYIKTITTDGDHDLGGKKWDKKFIELVKDKFEEQTGFDGSYDKCAEQYLIIECEKKKKQLTSAGRVEIYVSVGQYRDVVDITREEFDAATKSLLDSAIELTKAVFERTKSYGEDITKILLVGGSTYMPQVRERLEKEFADITIEVYEPDLAVAEGACLFAINRYEPEEWRLLQAKIQNIKIVAASDYTLEDMIDTVPEDKKVGVIVRLKLVQDSIKELDCQDVFQWLNGMSEGALITRESNKDDIINCCSEIYSNWHRRHPTGENIKQIVLNTKLAATFKAFMNDDTIPDPVKTYYQYLKYREVETILKNMSAELRRNDQSELELSKFKEYVDYICRITANRDNAKSILINYCVEHYIKIE